MSIRTIENPGIEINEIDRSQYDKVDYSLQDAPTVLTMGFASQGEDFALNWINSKDTLDETYGQPTNEYEKYFYNSIYEVLNHGGTCIASKLPYDNNAYEKFNFIEFQLGGLNDSFSRPLSSIIHYHFPPYNTLDEIKEALCNVIESLNENPPDNFTILGMNKSVVYLYNKYSSAKDQISEQYLPIILQIKEKLESFINNANISTDFAPLTFNDSNITSYVPIINYSSGKASIETLDKNLTNRFSVLRNHIRIYDITKTQYKALNTYDGCVKTLSKTTKTMSSQKYSSIDEINTNECLGIVPVLVTAPNAMFFQNVLNFDGVKICDYSSYNQLSTFTTVNEQVVDDLSIETDFEDIDSHAVIPIASLPNLSAYSTGSDYTSLSRIASLIFPQINYNGPEHFDTTNLKNIGVAVFKAYADTNNNGKINFSLVENFVGSLSKSAQDPITKASLFIDNIVNSQSQYIRFFSNVEQTIIDKTSTFLMSKQPATSLGFYNIDCKKKISYNLSLMSGISRILDKASNPNSLPLDIVVDAGISNISQLAYIKNFIDADVNPNIADIDWNLLTDGTNITGWRAAVTKFDNFAKYTRKDCMFIADGIRSMCLNGNEKCVRKTCPQNTVANTIIPRFRYMTNVLNSSYSAGYCNWFYQPDYSTGGNDYIWIPPSIKAAGVYIYCSTYFHPWSAPAGQVRGIIDDALDVAFIPLDSDAGQIYSNQWNYAMSYPLDGIVIEGHKTFQTQKTALDRINVRRLMLDMEKKISRIARHFVYEGNTPYMRQRFVDEAKKVLDDAVSGDGINEYAIKCDDELNTVQVIENNEMRCKIAIKPVKCVDFIVIDIISTRQSANVNEEVLR